MNKVTMAVDAGDGGGRVPASERPFASEPVLYEPVRMQRVCAPARRHFGDSFSCVSGGLLALALLFAGPAAIAADGERVHATPVSAPADAPEPAAAGEASPGTSAAPRTASPAAQSASPPAVAPVDTLIRRLGRRALVLVDSAGKAIAERKGEGTPERITESDVIQALAGGRLDSDRSATLWSFMADEDHTGFVTRPIVTALLAATDNAKAREALWNELSELVKSIKPTETARRNASLLGFFERHRDALRPMFAAVTEGENSDDGIMLLAQSTRVFGASLNDSIVYLAGNKPTHVARRIERDRERGKPVAWEQLAFDEMLRWRDARLVPTAKAPPATLAELDTASANFVTIFNSLHGLDEKYRAQMLKPLDPHTIYNIAVGGEEELYRLGTSGYREHMHPVILKGLQEAGSFEAFLDKATPRRLGDAATAAAGRRALVFLRVASSFGMLDSVLETVRDRETFIAQAVASLGDPKTVETSSTIVMDILTSKATSTAAHGFRRALLDRLYAEHDRASGARRGAFGSILSAYQTLSDDRRNPNVDREFPLDRSLFLLPFDRVFSRDGRGGLVHRMVMRLDEDVDAQGTYTSFRRIMRARGALVRESRTFESYRLQGRGRVIEIYANKPTTAGVKEGMADLAKALTGLRVETVIGRGHTGIIDPLQRDAKRILGTRVRSVSTVIVGSCGGNASVREMIGTFGYVPFVTSKSTGRQVLNNALIVAYIDALLELQPKDRFALQPVLDRAMTPFRNDRRDEDLREDANLYVVNVSTMLAAFLMDKHVVPVAAAEAMAARQ